MASLAHCSFVETELKSACRKGGVFLVITGESHTTKTCFKCFEVTKIGSNTVFKCDFCGATGPRDGKSCLCGIQRTMVFLPRHLAQVGHN